MSRCLMNTGLASCENASCGAEFMLRAAGAGVDEAGGPRAGKVRRLGTAAWICRVHRDSRSAQPAPQRAHERKMADRTHRATALRPSWGTGSTRAKSEEMMRAMMQLRGRAVGSRSVSARDEAERRGASAKMPGLWLQHDLRMRLSH